MNHFLGLLDKEQMASILVLKKSRPDEGRAVDVACLDFSKAFVTVSHNILIGKLRNVGWMSGQ